MRILFLMMAMAASVGFAQMPACDGDIAMVRISTIKPGGTMQNFLAAIETQKAWYRANGVQDNQLFVARLLVGNRGSRDMKYSETEAISYHVRPPSMDRIPNRGDAGWKAFVKLFQDNSEIKNEYMACMPKQK